MFSCFVSFFYFYCLSLFLFFCLFCVVLFPFFFCLCCAPCEVMVLWLGVKPKPPWWENRVPDPGNINWHELTQRSSSRPQDLAPPICLYVPRLNSSWQTNSKTRTQAHPSADGLPKVILSSQTPQNTSPKVALPIRETRPSSIYERAGTSPSHQDAYTNPWTNLTHWGQTSVARGTLTLQPVERDHKHSKLDKMR